MNPTLTLLAWLLLFPAPSAASGGGLERALESIRAENIRADLYFFADDEMEGRDTPSRGLAVAADFLRARLERLGFRPGAGEGYFQDYPVTLRRIDPQRSSLTLRGGASEIALAFGKDYAFSSSRDVRDLDLSAPLVFCGAGQKEELLSLDLTGKLALCVASDLSTSKRRRNLEKVGALGALVVPAGASDPFLDDYRQTTTFALEPHVALGEPSEAGAPLPQVFLSQDAARRILTASPARGGVELANWKPAPGLALGLTAEDLREGTEVVSVANVCGFWPGSDPELAKQVILISAHYDHIGLTPADAEGQRPADFINNGADDNGSGSMGLLAIAEALATWGPLPRSVMLIWVSGEEKGLWGSQHWTKAPTLPEGTRAICDLNIDMIGRNARDYLLITPSPAHPAYNGLTRIAERVAPLEGFPSLGSCDDYWARSDHMNFSVNLHIPVAFLFSDVHEDYHEPSDEPAKIDYDKIQRVARLVVRMIGELQSDPLDLSAKQ